MRVMRTTIDLPDDLHALARSIARDRGESLSETVAALIRRGLGQRNTTEVERSELTGLPIVRVGRTVTLDDVRSLDDESNETDRV